MGVRSIADQLAYLDEAGRAELLAHLQAATPLGDSAIRATSETEPGADASTDDGHAARLAQFRHDRAKARETGGPLA